MTAFKFTGKLSMGGIVKYYGDAKTKISGWFHTHDVLIMNV